MSGQAAEQGLSSRVRMYRVGQPDHHPCELHADERPELIVRHRLGELIHEVIRRGAVSPRVRPESETEVARGEGVPARQAALPQLVDLVVPPARLRRAEVRGERSSCSEPTHPAARGWRRACRSSKALTGASSSGGSRSRTTRARRCRCADPGSPCTSSCSPRPVIASPPGDHRADSALFPGLPMDGAVASRRPPPPRPRSGGAGGRM